MSCSRCGADLAPGTRTCSQCGAEQTVPCPNCRSTQPVGATICARCGAALSTETSEPDGTRPPGRGSGPVRMRWATFGVALAVVLLGAAAATAMWQAASPTNGVLAVAFGLDETASTLTGYVADPAVRPFRLPPGSYYVEAVDQDGYAISLGRVNLTTDGDVLFPASFSDSGGVRDEQRVRELETIANFLASAGLGQLAAYEAASGGFVWPLYDPNAEATQAQLDNLFTQMSDSAARQAQVDAAIESVERRAGAFALEASADAIGERQASGPFDKIKSSLNDFFGYVDATGTRARERIINDSRQLSPEDKEDAFSSIDPDRRGGANNYDEFLAVLATGTLDNQATRIEADLRNAPGYAAAAQQNGNTVNQIAKKEGTELVTKGAKLNVDIMKTVLGQVFPGISKGFDYADKAAQFTQYVNDAYAGAIGTGKAPDQVKADINDRIKSDLRRTFPNLPPDQIDQIAVTITDQVIIAISAPPTTPGVAGATEVAPPPPPPVPPADTPQPTPSPRPAPTDTPQVTPSPTPSTPSPTGTQTGVSEEYFVFALTNVGGGAFHIATESSLQGRTRCEFVGGGEACTASDVVTYSKLAGPFDDRTAAEAAFCAGVTDRRVYPVGIGLKGKWQGGAEYGIWEPSVAAVDCGTPTPGAVTGTPTSTPAQTVSAETPTVTAAPPTNTPVPPTNTPVPPTATVAPATATPVPATSTPRPTVAPLPPAVVPLTSTPTPTTAPSPSVAPTAATATPRPIAPAARTVTPIPTAPPRPATAVPTAAPTQAPAPRATTAVPQQPSRAASPAAAPTSPPSAQPQATAPGSPDLGE